MKDKNEISSYITDNAIDIDKIVDDYTPYIRTIIQNMIGNNLSVEDKEEIISDTFFVLWKRYNENYAINSLSSYMAGITRNLVKEKLKFQKHNTSVSIDKYENLIEYSNIDTYSEERDEINELYKNIKNLKTIDIKIIKMFYYSTKSIKDIAKELNISEINVKTRLHRIRKKIRKKLKQGGF